MSEVLKFLNYIDSECEKHGFELELVNTKYIDIGDGAPCTGYFSEDEKKICVTIKARDFIGILAHEFSHLRQYIEDEETYNYYSLSYEKMYEWLDGKRVRNISNHLDNCLALELDCEKRAVQLIKKYDLGIDIKDYIKRANAYMYFWKYLLHSRKWCNPYNTPSNNDNIVSIMPSKFLNDYTLTDNILAVFKSENI